MIYIVSHYGCNEFSSALLCTIVAVIMHRSQPEAEVSPRVEAAVNGLPVRRGNAPIRARPDGGRVAGMGLGSQNCGELVDARKRSPRDCKCLVTESV